MAADAPPPPTDPPSPWRWWVCALLFLATTLNYMDRSTLSQTGDKIKTAFGLNNESFGLVESTFNVGFGIGTLICGWVVDRVSVRWVYPVLVVGWSAAGFLTGYATEVWALFACRLLLGLFEAGNWPCGIRTTRQVLPPAERSLGNALFQGGTAVGAIVTTQIVAWCYLATSPDDPEAWRLPFKIIGLVGILWVALWVVAMPRGLIRPPQPTGRAEPGKPFTAVLKDLRFWLLAALVIGVNAAWHTGRQWFPLYLRERLQFGPLDVQAFGFWYFVVAEVGSLSVGLLTLGLVRAGRGLHRTRVVAYAACTLVALVPLCLPFVPPRAAPAVLFFLAFGSYGLFPTYFALSQEVSAEHQGKLTGSLGVINSAFLFVMYWAEGRVIDLTGRHEWVLAVSGVPAAVAVACLILFWPKPAEGGDVPLDRPPEPGVR